ncbi:hypothetical protein MYX82_00555 [Acidobacteria bacterium AH-259-D05]|nr:hypothetical protein [Acidobacteria bacterium AH-259-D05]
MLNCKEVARTMASDQIAEAGRWERFRVRLHLLMCRYCQRYEKQLRDIGRAARKLRTLSSQDHSTIERLERRILEGSLGDRGTDGGNGPIDPQ